MKKKNIRCPICAEKMKPDNHRWICHHCGYILNENASTTSRPSTAFDYESNHPSTLRRKIKKVQNYNIHPVRIIIILYLIGSVICGFLEVQKLNSVPQPTIPDTTYHTNDTSNSNLTPTQNQGIPKSEFFITFAEQVFQKDISAIRPEELTHITSIRIYRDENQTETIAYTIDNFQEETISFPVILNYNYTDLSCFTGLKSLIIEDGSGMLRKGDLDGLTSLQEIYSDKTPAELAEILPAPEKLKILGIKDSFFLRSFEGIEFFQNLTVISIDGGSLKTLNGLELLPSLKSLALSGNQIEDFSALYKLSELEYLSIESSSLKEIGFIEKMPNLKSLSIENASLLQIQPLASCAESLQNLSLWHIYKVEDYSVLDSLNHLITLQIELPYNYPPLSFSHMKELKELSLGRVSDISTIATAPYLQTLKLDSCNGEQLSALTSLSELKSLEISHLSGYFLTLEPLNQLTDLQQLSLDNCRIYANVEGVLALPALKEFRLKDCSIGFDFQNLPENSNLEILTIENTILVKIHRKGESEYGEINKENTYSLSDYSDTLKKFPNLIEVTLIGNELDNVRFAAELKKLQKLDITNNYVTDLTPLSQLDKLQTVRCLNNPIVYTEGVKAKIIQ